MIPHISFTQQIDVPEVVFLLFCLFFAGLIYHLRQEDKREGYPLESDRTDMSGGRVKVVGFPPMPTPKVFLRKFGPPVLAPGPRLERDIDAVSVPAHRFPGSPIIPTGDPLIDGIGPASYALKEEVPDMNWHGAPNILPLRKLPDYGIEETERNPIGMEVVTRDGMRIGTICDVWINIAELFGRYFEVQMLPEYGGDRAILPVAFADLRRRERLAVVGMLSAPQFSKVPRLAQPDLITMREEDRINGYFAGGYLYGKDDGRASV